MRHGAPEIKMKDDLIKIIYFVHTARGSTGHFYYSKRQVYYTGLPRSLKILESPGNWQEEIPGPGKSLNLGCNP